ncbi:MAG: PP2C family serine/threonine-protein phosphatase [Ilumatobacter sp.]|uniref:PP2C family serine/threonine-protein phosphatase n=1 Tax=Ilumatobacter sp. TaxID=1967498 RepID=UPI003C76A1EF
MADLAWGAGTHPGQIRPDNEDHLHASNGIYVVADGMGGHEAGEIASALAVERIRDVLIAEDLAPTAERVVEAISDANGDIFRAAIANPGQTGMGTTVTAIAVIEDPMAGRGAPNIDDNDGLDLDRVTPVVPRDQPEALVLANVGDSRTYLYRHGRLRRVTIDHSYVQELVSTGHITDDEARTHPRRNIITRALGIEPDVKVDWWTLPLVRGDRFVLCSDGLVDEITDPEISQVLRDNADPQAAVDLLISMANDAGGRDNVTIIIVDVLEGDDPPDPTQELDLTPMWADDPNMTADDFARIEAGDLELAGVDEPTEEVAVTNLSRKERRRARKAGDDDGPAADSDRDESTDDDADATSNDAAKPDANRPRLGRAVAMFVVLALLISGFVAFSAWARSGYFVDFDDNDRVTVYNGQPGGVLWFDPTTENTVTLTRDDITDASADIVDRQPEFSDLGNAIAFVRGLEQIMDDAADGTDAVPDDDTETTTATTTVPDTAATSVPDTAGSP